MVYAIKEHDIPSSLILNCDQTGVVYAPGTGVTYAERGSKQVSVVGKEEKRAFTTLITVSDDGNLLPFQGIYIGSTHRSQPDKTSRGYQELAELGCKFVSSGTDNHWANQQTTRAFITDIVAPYLKKTKERLHLPQSQKSILDMDLWAVHRSKEFGDWMEEHYPDIIINFVPGGCTPKFQPCDVGINRPFKHAIRRSFHQDMVSEYLRKIGDAKKSGVQVNFDRKLKSLRNQSVGWMWDAWQEINDPDLVKTVRAQQKYSEKSNIDSLVLEIVPSETMGSVV